MTHNTCNFQNHFKLLCHEKIVRDNSNSSMKSNFKYAFSVNLCEIVNQIVNLCEIKLGVKLSVTSCSRPGLKLTLLNVIVTNNG